MSCNVRMLQCCNVVMLRCSDAVVICGDCAMQMAPSVLGQTDATFRCPNLIQHPSLAGALAVSPCSEGKNWSWASRHQGAPHSELDTHDSTCFCGLGFTVCSSFVLNDDAVTDSNCIHA